MKVQRKRGVIASVQTLSLSGDDILELVQGDGHDISPEADVLVKFDDGRSYHLLDKIRVVIRWHQTEVE